MPYILHDGYKKQTYYGPFDDEEIPELIRDPYGLELSLTGRVLMVYLSEDELPFYYIHSPEFWQERVDDILDPDPFGSIDDVSDEALFQLDRT